MEKRLKCDFCSSSLLTTIVHDARDYESNISQQVDLLKCKSCKLVQQSLIFSDSELAGFYKTDYRGRNYSKSTFLSSLSNQLRRRYYLRFVEIISNYSNDYSINILDYGSGDGFLLKLLRSAGYKHLYSCDFFLPTELPSESVTHFHPRDLGKYVNKFDVVLMINSIEHLSSFREGMSKVTQSMREHSIIIIETPNIDSLDFAIFKRFWGGLHQPRHTYLWSKSSIVNHLRVFGFTSSHLGSPQSAHWAISIQNRLCAKFSIMRGLLKNGRIPCYVIIVILVLPLGIVQNFFGRESVLNVVGTRGHHG